MRYIYVIYMWYIYIYMIIYDNIIYFMMANDISRERNNIFRSNEMISRERNNIFRYNEMISRERNNINFFHRCPLRGSVPMLKPSFLNDHIKEEGCKATSAYQRSPGVVSGEPRGVWTLAPKLLGLE